MPKNFQLAMYPLGSEPYTLITQTERNLNGRSALKLTALPAMLCRVFSRNRGSSGNRYRAPKFPLLLDTSLTNPQVTGSKKVILPTNQTQFAFKAGPSLLSPFPSFQARVEGWPGSNKFSSMNPLTMSIFNKMTGAWAPKQVLQGTSET